MIDVDTGDGWICVIDSKLDTELSEITDSEWLDIEVFDWRNVDNEVECPVVPETTDTVGVGCIFIDDGDDEVVLNMVDSTDAWSSADFDGLRDDPDITYLILVYMELNSEEDCINSLSLTVDLTGVLRDEVNGL